MRSRQERPRRRVGNCTLRNPRNGQPRSRGHLCNRRGLSGRPTSSLSTCDIGRFGTWRHWRRGDPYRAPGVRHCRGSKVDRRTPRPRERTEDISLIEQLIGVAADARRPQAPHRNYWVVGDPRPRRWAGQRGQNLNRIIRLIADVDVACGGHTSLDRVERSVRRRPATGSGSGQSIDHSAAPTPVAAGPLGHERGTGE